LDTDDGIFTGHPGIVSSVYRNDETKNAGRGACVIYGAGRGGELLLREILNNKALNINPVGFLDDDPLKIGKKIQGFPILGEFDKLTELKNKHAIRRGAALV
jgi:FlaA1/EpsC-like NDP-sugar epimerase